MFTDLFLIPDLRLSLLPRQMIFRLFYSVALVYVYGELETEL
jgi:hypothetical protein